jgi:hypothetical protein
MPVSDPLDGTAPKVLRRPFKIRRRCEPMREFQRSFFRHANLQRNRASVWFGVVENLCNATRKLSPQNVRNSLSDSSRPAIWRGANAEGLNQLCLPLL